MTLRGGSAARAEERGYRRGGEMRRAVAIRLAPRSALPLGLLLVTVVATLIPAARAVRVHPVVALRSE